MTMATIVKEMNKTHKLFQDTISVCLYLYVYLSVYVSVCLCAFVCVSVCAYVSMIVCM